MKTCCVILVVLLSFSLLKLSELSSFVEAVEASRPSIKHILRTFSDVIPTMTGAKGEKFYRSSIRRKRASPFRILLKRDIDEPEKDVTTPELYPSQPPLSPSQPPLFPGQPPLFPVSMQDFPVVPVFRPVLVNETEAERAERVHRAFEKMMTFVDIMGQVDNYFSTKMKSFVKSVNHFYNDGEKEELMEGLLGGRRRVKGGNCGGKHS